MRKTIFIIAAVAAMACACNKSETVKIETPNQISFAKANTGFVKSNELTEETFREGWVMHVSATRRNDIGEVVNKNYFEDAVFESTNPISLDAEFFCTTPKYWPVGGDVLDFIAFACHESEDSVGRFGDYEFGETAAETLTFTSFDTYPTEGNPQIDLVYAVENKCSAVHYNVDGSVPTSLNFKHAQALLEFQAQTNITSGEEVYIDSIVIKDLRTKGKFIIENTKIEKDTAYWEGVEFVSKHDTIPGCCADSVKVNSTTMTKVGQTLLIPEQERKEITIVYHVVKPEAGATTDKIVGERLTYTFSGARGAWTKGKKYTYQLTVNPMEIAFTESVTKFEDSDDDLDITAGPDTVTP